MANSSIIRSVLAGFLLVVFAFGITPKRTLHNLVATHKDGSANAAANHSDEEAISKSTFNCQCDNLISESPFVAQSYPVNVSLAIPYASYSCNPVAVYYSSDHFSFGLRGPPFV